jgi:hypothetical protein
VIWLLLLIILFLQLRLILWWKVKLYLKLLIWQKQTIVRERREHELEV